MGLTMDILILAALSAVLVLAAVRDLQTRRISNRLVGLALVLVVALWAVEGIEPWHLGILART
jgi:Flp pilus assembly protein protease CpaA